MLDHDSPSEIVRRLAELRREHRDLDAEVLQLQASIIADELAVKRLKKRKLWLKDRIQIVLDAQIPDIIA